MRRIACCLIATLLASNVAYAADELVPAPKGAPPLLAVDADGVQIYTCEAKDQGFAWVFKAPEANLFDKQGRQIGTHFAGPSWKFADGSVRRSRRPRRRAGERRHSVVAAQGQEPRRVRRAGEHGLHPSHRHQGRAAPTAGCDAAHKGEQARVRYYALYQFFGAAK